MSNYRVVLYWRGSHQDHVVEADTADGAKTAVLRQYNWHEANYPDAIATSLTNDPVGIGKYYTPGRMWDYEETTISAHEAVAAVREKAHDYAAARTDDQIGNSLRAAARRGTIPGWQDDAGNWYFRLPAVRHWATRQRDA